jgi:hypothetical protein
MTWLAVTPQRFPDESVVGYRCRVAAKNGYQHWPSFVKAFLRFDKNQTAHYLKTETQSLLGVELALHTPIDDIFRLYFIRRVCPLCLQQAIYMREAWHLSLVTHCLHHGVELIDRCPDCGKALDNHWGSIAHCRCGFDLRLVEPCERDPILGMEWLIAQRAGAVATRAISLPEPVQQLSPKGLERFTLLMGSYAQFGYADKPRKVAIRSDLRSAMRVTNAADQIANTWPAGFYRLLDQRSDDNKRHIQSHFGHLYRAAYHDLCDKEFAFLRQAMDDYVASNWTGLITCKNTWQSPRLRNKPPYLSSTLLSKQTRINRQQYALWIDQGKLKGCIRETANGRQRVSIAADQEELIDQLSRQRTLKQISRQLGLPENRVRELIATGLLTGYRSNAGGPWHVDPVSVQQMMDNLRTMRLRSLPKNRGLTMDCILRHRMDGAVSFSKLIIALKDGVVPFSMVVGFQWWSTQRN